MPKQISFAPFQLPNGESAFIPANLHLKIPENSALDANCAHALVYIPWDDAYLARVPNLYQDFFKTVFPYLHTRTTNVHIATCLPFVQELIAATPERVDERVIYIGFILHDAGWSQLSETEIADSLGVQGLALAGAAVSPKEKHAIIGKEIAQRVLSEFAFEPPLSEAQKNWICQAVLYHDKPWELAQGGDIPIDVKLVCDVDHLWSFTRENFWQDTVRKRVSPVAYAENLAKDLDGYFVTEQGKSKARGLLEERRDEVRAWEKIAKKA